MDDGERDGCGACGASSDACAACDRLCECVDFGRYRALLHVGAMPGPLARALARRHSMLRCTGLDLPGPADRMPTAEVVVTVGVVLRLAPLHQRMLIRKTHDGLRQGGCLVVVDRLCGGEGCRAAERLAAWALDAGFVHTQAIALAGTFGAAVAYK